MEFISRQRIAEILGVSTRTVSRLMERGEIRTHRVGRQLRVREEDLQKYLESVVENKGKEDSDDKNEQGIANAG